MISFKERVEGVVFGTAYGDALGATVEKLTSTEIRKKYERVETIDVAWHKENWEPEKRLYRMRGYGIYTDDTLMTEALINVYSTLERHVDAYDFASEFIKEIAFRPRYIPELDKEALIIDRLFYPDKYPFVKHTLANCEPREGGIGNMVNCGAAMYIAPVGVINACNPTAAYNEAISFASGHQCSYGLEAAGVLAATVAKAFETKVTIEEITDTAIEFAKDGTKSAIIAIVELAKKLKNNYKDKDFVISEFHKAIKKFSPMGDDINRNIDKVGKPSNHYTPSRIFSIEELPIALGYIVINDGDFYESINDGINSGRDTDSIGVMIGVILGAFHGSRVFKREIIETINTKNKTNLYKTAEKLKLCAQKINKNDLEELYNRTKNLEEIDIWEE
ncbi:MAG: ADP-ribosylglycohydrolase family protein [Alkaliphilus sp.]